MNKKESIFYFEDVVVENKMLNIQSQKLNFKIEESSKNCLFSYQSNSYFQLRNLLLLITPHIAGKVFYQNNIIKPWEIESDYEDRICFLRSEIGFVSSQPILINNLNLMDNIVLSAQNKRNKQELSDLQLLTTEYFLEFSHPKNLNKRPLFVSYFERFVSSLIRLILQKPKIILFENAFFLFSEEEVLQLSQFLMKHINFNEITFLNHFYYDYSANEHHIEKMVLKNKNMIELFGVTHVFEFKNEKINEITVE